jgi:adenylate cyclase
LGDGVNIAARLENLSQPGGVMLSDDAYRQVRDRLEIAWEDGGEHEVKNIARPIQVWRWPNDNLQKTPAGKDVEVSLPLPGGPSVAVLPFENKSGDPDQSYFSDGLTGNIITGLTRFRGILVIGEKSILIARERSNDLSEIGRALGVAHIVEGSVRKFGNRVRVKVQLVDAASGQHLWAENYDRALDDIFAVEDEITAIIVGTLAGQIEQVGLRHAKKRPAVELAAYDYVLKGRQCLNRYSKEGEFEARRHFEKALELDPEYASAFAGLSVSFGHEYWGNWSNARDEALERAYSLAQTAVALDETDGQALYALAGACYYRDQHELAEVHINKAIELNPNDYHNVCMKIFLLAATDRSSESISCATESVRLNPLAPDHCYFGIGIAEYVDGRYEEALAAFGKVVGWGLLRPAWIAACYAQLGQDDQARAAASEVRGLAPTDPGVPDEDEIERWQAYWTRVSKFKDPEHRKRFFEGLRKAGLPA